MRSTGTWKSWELPIIYKRLQLHALINGPQDEGDDEYSVVSTFRYPTLPSFLIINYGSKIFSSL